MDDHYRKILQKLIETVSHVVCYVRRNSELLSVIEKYCEKLPIANSKNLNEKAYWFLHGLKDYPKCQCKDCINDVSFKTLKKGYSMACCAKHASIISRPKVAATNLKKYGSTTPLQNKEIRAKINQHNLETYGTENVVESEHFKKKRLETCRKNFGVDYPMQNNEVMQKRIETCRKKYGVDWVLQNEEVKEKGIETSQKLYGCDYPMQSESFKEKSRATMQKNYNVNAPAQCPEIRRKQQLRCKYNGMNFDSIYEIAYYIWLSDHRIKFQYEPNVTFKYIYDDKEHFYMPDFKVEDQYIEIKGDHFFKKDGTMQNPYDHSQDGLYEAKHQCMLANSVNILKVSEMKDILDYIYKTYGRNYLKQFRKCEKKNTTPVYS